VSNTGRVFVIYNGPTYPRLSGLLGSESGIVRSLTTHIDHNGRCRTLEFMRTLASEHGAESVKVVSSGEDRLELGKRGSEVVLLWKDAIGAGCGPLEKRILRSGAHVTVVTGRRRTFELTRERWRKLRFRRALEKCLVGEILFTVVFFVASPGLVAWDWMRGRR
jgi:hypothetical protein